MKTYLGKLLESGAALAAAMGTLYFLTYLRLNGILAAYSLPDELVSIDVPDIIATLRELVMNFWAVLCVPGLALLFIRRVRDEKLMSLLRLTIVLATAVTFSVSLEKRFNMENLILIGICAYEWCEALIRVIINGKGERGLKAKWRAASDSAPERGDSVKAASAIGWFALGIAVVFVLSGSIMEHFAAQELNREWYFVAEDYDNRVVVFQNDDQYILMERSNTVLNPKYEVVHYRKIGKLSYENLGYLTLKVPAAEQ